MKGKKRSFEAKLERMPGNLGWVIAKVPFDVERQWGSKSRLKVKVEIGGEQFRTSLFPSSEGKHFILVNKKMQAAGRVKVGMTARFNVEPDTDSREVDNPTEFEKTLKAQKQLRSWYNGLNHSTRNWIAKWIAEPKSLESRRKRAEQMVERLLETMEAEVELPPLINKALDETPYARRGWELLTPIQRRSHLLGIFYYRTPEARRRRMDKAIEAAVAAANRK
jgi:uncharacterized protein YdeI (YjbR/CyaY-like superfamily)